MKALHINILDNVLSSFEARASKCLKFKAQGSWNLDQDYQVEDWCKNPLMFFPACLIAFPCSRKNSTAFLKCSLKSI